MQTALPFIPENAPFTPEQRGWLNGFLAGLFSATPQEIPQPAQLEPVNIYFATQSGTAERLAKKLAKALKAKGHTVVSSSIDKVKLSDLAPGANAVFFASTYGEGDPPDHAKGFRDMLAAAQNGVLRDMRYAVFCLGDRNYEQFCKFGIDLDERLAELGANRITVRVESDVEVDEPFETWQSQLLGLLAGTPKIKSDSAPATVVEFPAPANIHTRDNPYAAVLADRTPLTHDVSSKLTVHLGFNLEDSPITYEAGDACGVVAQNDPAVVADILAAVPFPGTDIVQIPKAGAVTIEEALLHHLQPTRLTRKIVQAFAAKAKCGILNNLLAPDQSSHLEAYMYDRGLVDLLHEYPGLITEAGELVSMLPKLAPRLYSISSSPAAHGREVHCTVAVVRYRSHNRERGGVASTMLADRVALGSRVPIYIHPNKRFRLPVDGNTPIVMIGPGTGIAPFRGFLNERRARGSRGKNWLFFGERSAQTDFLYRDELETMRAESHLTRLDTAFSRDQAHKIYVQDRMLEAGAELWRWLEEGAQVYVCGDASRMAKDVESALHRVIESHGGMSQEAAQEYVSQLQESHRYHKDVY